MKESKDNQMELLLRTLGASSPMSVDSAVTVQQTEHLDADEMNAFAEGQLSDRTRARYVAHLADCGSCRSIIASLPQTVEAFSKTVAPEHASGFWARLTAFFSPAVLRYAIPALVLAAVVGVSFLALRQQRETAFVARNEENSEADKRNAAPGLEGSSATTAAPAQAPVPAASVPTENYADERRSKNPSESSTKPGPPSGEAPLSDLNAAPATTATNQPVDSLYKQAEQPPPPPKPEAPVIMSETAKEEAEDRQARRRENDKLSQPGSADSSRGAAPASGGVLSARKVQELPASQRGYELKRKDADEEVRTVGGRHFRRQGSAWIDTAFSTGRSTINVSRGSEHYRTLMGDEPGLRAIVEQIGGEVVVIWNGKAYRIR